MVSVALDSLLKLTNNPLRMKYLKGLIVVSLILSIIFSWNVLQSYTRKKFRDRITYSRALDISTYSGSKFIIRKLMEKLDISPEYFSKNVLWLDFRPNSKKRIELAFQGNSSKNGLRGR